MLRKSGHLKVQEIVVIYEVAQYVGSIYVYILWSCAVAGLWYPRSCVAAQLRLQSHSRPPSDLCVGVVYPGGFYVPLLGIEIIDGGSFGIISPPNRCR